ncbi:hypothetical protein Cni_G09599 [Canna indica]|uniref:T-complex protein 11 n=1 Tax=Canna indica TaxID=4628 RepID=A0AAQ3Q920_9LILI|nr:hypothetical protein Cni_G09599 [Canna indica]
MGSGGGVETPAAERPAAVALDFPAGEPSSPARVPQRIRRRLLEGRSGNGASSVEEIEAKLREADLRRQQFREFLSSKARKKARSSSWSSQEEDLGQRLEAKLFAAEQKRLSLLVSAQMRLARVDELRQAAKSGAKIRFEKEREELGTKVQSRVKQAEANRMRLLKAHIQRRAMVQERTANSLLQRIVRETKYKECVRSAIIRKLAAAEKKRMGMLEAEKRKAHARVVQVRKVSQAVCDQRKTERRRLKELLDNRLQMAKKQRAEYLKQRGKLHSPVRIDALKNEDFLSRKLARCWRKFVRSRRTSLVLAKAYDALGINENSAKSMPFDQLAFLIESTKTLGIAKALLDRLESCFSVLVSSTLANAESIDHLLKRLSPSNRRIPSGRAARCTGATRKAASKEESRSPQANKFSRYPVRIVLSTYMILGHANVVFNDQGEREVALRESAVNFIWEFELLIKIILDGPNIAQSANQSLQGISGDSDHLEKPCSHLPHKKTFRSQLAAFDTAWRAFLYQFVIWKTCKLTSAGRAGDKGHDMGAIQNQVMEDQMRLREKVQQLSGSAGVERMENALSNIRSKFFETHERRSPLAISTVHVSSPSKRKSSEQPLSYVSEEKSAKDAGTPRFNHVAYSLFGSMSSSLSNIGSSYETSHTQSSSTMGRQPPTENELLLNELIHQSHAGTFSGTVDVLDSEGSSIKIKVKETMENAFWDAIMDSMKEEPDYSRVVDLVNEVRDELYELAPQCLKQEILDVIDLDILSQVLESGTLDIEYLGRILEYTLLMLQKLSAPANEDEMRKTHQNFLRQLAEITQTDDVPNHSCVIATIKGLRFVLDQIKVLKKEVSKAHMLLLEPIVKGSAGLEYLQKAFSDRYGPPTIAASSLPLTIRWLSSLKYSLEEEWNEHFDLCSHLTTNHGLPPTTTLRTGGSMASKESVVLNASGQGGKELPECRGDKVEKVVRLGLLKLASAIEGLTIETVPETLKLNVLRLKSVQSQLQQIIVITTSILVLRQVLLSENPSASPLELESAVSDTAKSLSELLERVPDVGIEEIMQTMLCSSCSSYSSTSIEDNKHLQMRKEMMERVLMRSLQDGNSVFSKVSRSVYLAMRGIVLGGSGTRGRKLADATLRRVGSIMLLEQVVKAAEVLIVMANVSSRVHGPWYTCIV